MDTQGAGVSQRQEDWTVKSILDEWLDTRQKPSRRKLAFLNQLFGRCFDVIGKGCEYSVTQYGVIIHIDEWNKLIADPNLDDFFYSESELKAYLHFGEGDTECLIRRESEVFFTFRQGHIEHFLRRTDPKYLECASWSNLGYQDKDGPYKDYPYLIAILAEFLDRYSNSDSFDCRNEWKHIISEGILVDRKYVAARKFGLWSEVY